MSRYNARFLRLLFWCTQASSQRPNIAKGEFCEAAHVDVEDAGVRSGGVVLVAELFWV